MRWSNKGLAMKSDRMVNSLCLVHKTGVRVTTIACSVREILVILPNPLSREGIPVITSDASFPYRKFPLHQIPFLKRDFVLSHLQGIKRNSRYFKMVASLSLENCAISSARFKRRTVLISANMLSYYDINKIWCRYSKL